MAQGHVQTLKRSPFHNFLPGALRVTQVHKIIYRNVPQGRLWDICLSTLALWPCTFCSDPIEMYKILTGKYDGDVTLKVTRVYGSTTRGSVLKLDKGRAKYDLRK